MIKCDKKDSFQECELTILRTMVDKATEIQGKKTAQSPETKKIIYILENFLRKKKLICYGGTAINNILPKKDQFYNKSVEVSDYDFYSTNAQHDAKELGDLYVENGFEEVEVKTASHVGTYKVFVQFLPAADISQIPKEIFNELKKESIKVAGILYAPPNFLRMGMYLELSRPQGDVSRWEKVLKRLTLLNKNYPLRGKNCGEIDFQRNMENDAMGDKIYNNVRDTLLDQGVVFFGGYALSMYSRYMPHNIRRQISKTPDFDVMSPEPVITAQIVKERLADIDVKNVKIIKRPGVGEIIAPHYEIKVGNDTIVFIYEPLACHSYNVVNEDGYEIKIATIDTMLSFWLAFLYSERPYYDKDRILCMANYLFEVQQKNRLQQKGLLKRFSLNCIGHQQTIEEMRSEKAEKFVELKGKKGDPEYDEWFLRYRPGDNVKGNKTRTKKGANKSIKKETMKTRTTNKRKRGTKKKRSGFLF